MRLLLLLFLFAPPLFAIDLEDVDRDTLRYVRLALLKDDIRRYFGLRIGDFESLDQALAVKLDGKPLLVLRLETKAAAILIHTDRDADVAGAHVSFEVEARIEADTLTGADFASVRCQVSEGGPQRTRLLRLKDDKLQLCLNWISVEQQTLEGGRYQIKTTRVFGPGLKLNETTEYLLDGKRVDGGMATLTTTLEDRADSLEVGQVAATPINVAQHCAIARRLERDAFNEAALHHARAALAQARLDSLAEGDARYLEAQALAAKLEARLRPAVVEGAASTGK